MPTEAGLTKGELMALFAGNTAVAITTLIGIAYFAAWIPINNTGDFWTNYMFVSVSLLVLYFVSVSITAITLRRLRKRLYPTNFNVFSAAVGIVLWVFIFIVWLAIVAEIGGKPLNEAIGLALYLLPATAIAMALFCYIVDEAFNRGP
jgi:hypothetical protein